MSEKKIVVPDGMLNAANERLDIWSGGPNSRVYCVEDRANVARVTLEAALLWLSEHPIVPTPDQMESMAQSLNSPWSICYIPFIAEWQRRMFLAPEPSIDPLVMYIMRHFEDGEPDRQTLRNRAEAAVADYNHHVWPESPKIEELPQCPDCQYIQKPGVVKGHASWCRQVAVEGIGDLLVTPVIGKVNGNQINDRIQQAYARGVKVGVR